MKTQCHIDDISGYLQRFLKVDNNDVDHTKFEVEFMDGEKRLILRIEK